LIPRILWLYWHQGAGQQPFLVRTCIESWITMNPDWQVVVLDGSSAGTWARIDLPAAILANLCLAHQSDLLRLKLLHTHGGVWADATTLCRIPLSQWLDGCMESGFFAFHKPGRDRLIANWFLACRPGCLIVSKLDQALRRHWSSRLFPAPNQSPTQIQKRTTALLAFLLNRSIGTTRLWFHPLVCDTLGITPYFVFHYMFARLVATDRDCRHIWQRTPQISAKPMRLIERLGFHTPLTPNLERQIATSRAPMFKLTWKYDDQRYVSHTLLHHLLQPESP